ncbi:helix-turn-helix domain-containing protein [Bradyrhizobium oligotrophicum]|uniref:helix-turn-helix domain-containing protein n=1 Tax=Bradyrhizobium oligotrophicum TaxID=44255 RepID=UPI003EBD44EA
MIVPAGRREASQRFTAALLLPRRALSACLFGAILRDTRGLALDRHERFNQFSASPLCGVTWWFEGESILVPRSGSEPAGEPLPRLAFVGPQQGPTVSYNPGPVFAMTLGFYPDAWLALTGVAVEPFVDRTVALSDILSGDMLDLFQPSASPICATEHLHRLESRLEPIWRALRPDGQGFGQRLGDWMTALAIRAATSKSGRSARQFERRIKSWAGQSLRGIRAYERSELLLAEVASAKAHGGFSWADLSAAAGFADQSHMIRQVRRETGFPPDKLLHLVDHHEAFWCYRLLAGLSE